MMNLYEITNEFKEMVSQLEDLELDPEVFQDTLDSLQAPIEEKIENIVKYMKSLEALADAKKLEAKRLSESASSDLKKVEWFKNYMADNLNKAGIKKLQAGVFSLGWRKGSEVVEVDESRVNTAVIPTHFMKYTDPVINKVEIKKALKEGYTFEGISLVRKPDSLTIK